MLLVYDQDQSSNRQKRNISDVIDAVTSAHSETTSACDDIENGLYDRQLQRSSRLSLWGLLMLLLMLRIKKSIVYRIPE
jgi:hypothetical protein